MDNNKYCVIMAGGIGSRFWPISRSTHPKQFLDILGTGKTFLRSTFERFSHVVPTENFLVVTNAVYKDLVLDQLPELQESQVLAEPLGRNTAPCITYAAFRLRAVNPDAVMIVTPSDHLIINELDFVHVIDESAEFVRDHDVMMTIGIRPDHPNTGYGYIQVEPTGPALSKFNKVKTFTEKPNAEMAKVFVDSGEFFWNAGIFIWRPNTILEAVERFLPDTYQLFDSISAHYGQPDEDEYIQRIYPECRGISIDFGVMEKAENVYVRCSDFGWSDIGTWNSLYHYSPKDENGNVVPHNSALYDTHGCIIKVPDGKMTVIEGLDDYIVVDKENVLMICPRENEQKVKKYIEDIKFKTGDRFI